MFLLTGCVVIYGLAVVWGYSGDRWEARQRRQQLSILVLLDLRPSPGPGRGRGKTEVRVLDKLILV